jgi:hypothetical protein
MQSAGGVMDSESRNEKLEVNEFQWTTRYQHLGLSILYDTWFKVKEFNVLPGVFQLVLTIKSYNFSVSLLAELTLQSAFSLFSVM